MSYKNLLEIRNVDIDGEREWTWIKEDQGAWGGPINDWAQHKNKYFMYLQKKRTCISAGGNCGLHARFYAKQFGTVYIFEPDALNFHCLVNNSQFDNVIKLNMALGSEKGFISMNRISMQNVGMHKVGGPGRIPMVTIDSFDFTDVDFIQLDVEGYEEKVLEGALNTINKYKPVIVTERDAAAKLLQSLGYVLATRSGHADCVWLHTHTVDHLDPFVDRVLKNYK